MLIFLSVMFCRPPKTFRCEETCLSGADFIPMTDARFKEFFTPLGVGARRPDAARSAAQSVKQERVGNDLEVKKPRRRLSQSSNPGPTRMVHGGAWLLARRQEEQKGADL
jgi:hypothetical protein